MKNNKEEFLIHLLLFLFTCGIGNVIYILIKNKNNNMRFSLNNIKYSNPYENAVPNEVFKYAYSENKSNKYPNDYVVFDTETTGLEPEIDRIIEISAIKYKNNEPIEQFNVLVNPKQKLDPFITNLTGINDNDLINRPTIDVILPNFFIFIEDYTLIAHNAPFDIKMIACECYRIGISMCKNKIVDTIPLAKKMIPKENISDYKLSTLKNYFGINIKSHRALQDCEMCNIVYQNFLKFNKHKNRKKRILIVDDETGEILE